MIIPARVRVVRASQSNEFCGHSLRVTLPGFSGVFLDCSLLQVLYPLCQAMVFGSPGIGFAQNQGGYIQVQAACCSIAVCHVVALDFLDLLG